MNQEVIVSTEEFVKNVLSKADSAHDWWHIQRVRRNAKNIIDKEDMALDELVVELSVLLHDVVDDKIVDDIQKQKDAIQGMLDAVGVEEDRINHVLDIISHISFSDMFEDKDFTSPEMDVVQDADRLDAMGAIGVARCFSYSGANNRPIYDPRGRVKEYEDKKEYREGADSAIHHFYEKLFLIKNTMNTKSGREIAEQRHAFMEGFIERFMEEWSGDL